MLYINNMFIHIYILPKTNTYMEKTKFVPKWLNCATFLYTILSAATAHGCCEKAKFEGKLTRLFWISLNPKTAKQIAMDTYFLFMSIILAFIQQTFVCLFFMGNEDSTINL